jgi:hypothetical protein
MQFNFHRTNNQIDWAAECPRFNEERAKDTKNVLTVSLVDKAAADSEILARVAKLQRARTDRSYAAAWAEFVDMARIPDTEERALFDASMRGVLVQTKNPMVMG